MELKTKTVAQLVVFIAIMASCLLTGCSTRKSLTLMPTPVIYQDSKIDPFAHLTAVQKSTKTEVFYATNRVPHPPGKTVRYGNKIGSTLHLGQATIDLGGPNENWEELLQSSLSDTEDEPVVLTVEKVVETTTVEQYEQQSPAILTSSLKIFIESINTELAQAVDKVIMVYVHGTKVDFANSIILTAEIDHFAGRDFVGVAFAWPSHQNILSYFLGIDVSRALDSSQGLQFLLTLLAEHTVAERINIIAYSAGGKVASKALSELPEAYPELTTPQLKEKFRLGSVVFAAADVEVDTFLNRMINISRMSDQIVITVTDDDNALKAAKRFMGGAFRAGALEAEQIEEDFITEKHLKNIEIVDVSIGKNVRGFDIVGHHYWYRHPWMSSEIIFLLRTGLPPSRRGLSPTAEKNVWYLSVEYPDKVQEAAATELEGQW